MGGEPTTAARRSAVEAAGAVALPRMGATETDILAYACAHPEAPDDMHFLEDRHALVQPGPGQGQPGVPDDAMLLTSLLDSAPLVLLNVCMGDRATLVRRTCGCGLDRDGGSLHVHGVRSFEKLTAGGDETVAEYSSCGDHIRPSHCTTQRVTKVNLPRTTRREWI